MTGRDAGAGQAVETMLLALIGVGLGIVVVLDVAAATAGLAFGKGWVWTPLDVMPAVVSALPDSLDDPRRAWPAPTRSALPGAAAMYATGCTLVAVPLAAAGLAMRRRTNRDEAVARWALRRDLRPLCGTGPGRLPLGEAHGRTLSSEPHQSLLVVAPTQSGKTTALAIPAILRWQGPVVAVSVKNDLLRDTLAHRSSLGLALVFDPVRSTAHDATASWTPLAGCDTWAGARRTAAWMAEAAAPARRGLAEGEFWYATAAKLLAPLLYAAATSGRTMDDVVRWLDTQEALEVKEALEEAGCEPALAAADASWARDSRQRSSVYTTAETIVEAYADPGVLASSRRSDIDAAALVVGGADTLYLCAGARDQRRLRPVFVTLLQEVLDAAYARSGETGSPLSPPLLIVLDEAANIAPLPDLDVIAATCAGHGVQLVTVLQDLAQAYDRWGRERADTIVNNHRARIFGAGLSDPRTLESVGRLLGQKEIERRSSTTGTGRATTTRATSARPLAPPNFLRETRSGHALLVYGTLPPIRLRLRPWFRDTALRRLTSPDPPPSNVRAGTRADEPPHDTT